MNIVNVEGDHLSIILFRESQTQGGLKTTSNPIKIVQKKSISPKELKYSSYM